MADEAAGGYPGGWWGAGASALGAGADLYAFFDNLKREAALKKLQEILENPAKLAAYIQSFYQPLSAAAIAATNRDVGANWAVQTGGAPGGAMNQFTADAFAKLESDRYGKTSEQAIQALLGAMRGGGGYGGTGRPMGNLGGILDILTKLRGAQAPTPPGPRQIPVPQPTPYPLPVPSSEPAPVGFGEGPFLT